MDTGKNADRETVGGEAHESGSEGSSLPEEQDRAVTIGARIRELREAKGWSLSELAKRAGSSKSALHDLETNASVRPSADLLYGIALALDTSVGYLLGRRVNPLAQGANEPPLEIPASLEQAAKKYDIPEEDKRALACIRYRGKKPDSVEDWHYLYETIRRVADRS